MPRHDATPPLPTCIIRIGLFDIPIQVPQIMDRTPITATTIDGHATPPKSDDHINLNGLATSTTRQLAPIINTTVDIAKGQVHLQNFLKSNQANYKVAPPASQYTSRHMGYNIIIRRGDKALTTPHCS
jgi:hypothetical protein